MKFGDLRLEVLKDWVRVERGRKKVARRSAKVQIENMHHAKLDEREEGHVPEKVNIVFKGLHQENPADKEIQVEDKPSWLSELNRNVFYDDPCSESKFECGVQQPQISRLEEDIRDNLNHGKNTRQLLMELQDLI